VSHLLAKRVQEEVSELPVHPITSERIQKTENPGNGFKPLLRRLIYNPLNNRVS
jgi:hypothetical protein